jgi:hypothetical protein
MLAAVGVETTSLAELPDYRALALAPTEDVSTTQAMFVPGVASLTPVDLVELGTSTPEVVAALQAQLAALPPVGAMSALGILGGVSDDEEVVTIALAVEDDDAAASAAAAVAERLVQAPSLREHRPLQDVLDEIGVTSVTTRTLPEGDDVAAAAVIELRAPLTAGDPGAGGILPSRLFRLLQGLVLTRDMAWLAPFVGSG